MYSGKFLNLDRFHRLRPSDWLSRTDQQAGNPHQLNITRNKKRQKMVALLPNSLAAGGGFEPPQPGPEPGVLPLDDPAKKLPQKIVKITKPVKRK